MTDPKSESNMEELLVDDTMKNTGKAIEERRGICHYFCLFVCLLVMLAVILGPVIATQLVSEQEKNDPVEYSGVIYSFNDPANVYLQLLREMSADIKTLREMCTVHTTYQQPPKPSIGEGVDAMQNE